MDFDKSRAYTTLNADEYATENWEYYEEGKNDSKELKQAYQQGAGFVYNKAKEIIKKFSEFVNNEVEFDPEHPQEHTDLWNELCEKAEQFISGVEDERSNL